MEFLRFGSSIPGSYWGCCAMCIIQNFKFDPDQKASIQLVSGDGGGPLTKGNQMLFAGPTYRDIFKQRIRIGTFSNQDMPNHGFLAVLTQEQISGGHGKAWLAILKEEGFEFIRTVDNSVYTGPSLDGKCSPHPNYLFGLFRNIGAGKIKDSFTPPPQWTDLPSVIPEAWQGLNISSKAIQAGQQEYHLKRWNEDGPTKLLTEDEIIKAGAPVVLAGLRSKYPQQKKEDRDKIKADEKAKTAATKSAFPDKVAVAAA